MPATPWVVLTRDCEALLIPSGLPFLIPSGTAIEVTQFKSGPATVNVNGQLARIEVKNLDALPGDFAQRAENAKQQILSSYADGPVNVDQVWDQLRTCYDPEIPVNVVDLGLIYACVVTPSADFTENHVQITMTLTAPACGMGPVIVQDVENAVLAVKNVTKVSIEIVFDPVWSRDMISETAKLELGLL